MSKFKVGDKVRVVKLIAPNSDGSDNRGTFVGKTGIILRDWESGYRFAIDNMKGYLFRDDELELVEEPIKTAEIKITAKPCKIIVDKLDKIDDYEKYLNNHLYEQFVLGKFNRKEGNCMNFINKIERYIINNKAVIIFWKSGDKTIAKVDEKDEFDKQVGFMIAFHKYLCQIINVRPYSKTEYKKIIDSVKNDKLKEYLFIFFNKYTFQDTIKSRKYLESLEVTK